MKRRKNNKTRAQKRRSSRHLAKQSRELGYDMLEQRQVLTVGIGFNEIGATLGEAGITSPLPNAEGDVGPDHYVEVSQQSYTVYARNGAVLESTTLNQFFVEAGGNLFGDTLESPRIIFDRGIDRWFVIAAGQGNGEFAGNRIHIAFSDTADPTGEWQQLDFVVDITGQMIHTNPSFGVDADGVYFATQNFFEGDFVDVSIYTVPKADFLLANPTIGRLTRHEGLSIFEYGRQIQFASNFEASDDTIFAFSTRSVDLNEGTGLPPNERLTPGTLNSFQIMDADGPLSILTAPVEVTVDAGTGPGGLPFVQPDPILQPIDNMDGTFTAVQLFQPGGLTASLIESNGSVFGAQTVGFDIDPGIIDIRNNGINWFQLDVQAGQDPVLAQSPLRGPVSHVFIDTTFFTDGMNVDFFPDPDDTVEQGAIDYYNPSIGISDNGVVALVFNGSVNFDAVSNAILDGETEITPETGAPFNLGGPDPDPGFFRISSYASIGLSVNGAAELDDMGNPVLDENGEIVYPRSAIQLEGPKLLQESSADGAFDQSPNQSLWGRYSSVRPDPANPNSLFSVIPFQNENNNERWTVALTELLPQNMRPVIEGTENDDVFVVSLDPLDSNFVQIEINGVVTDRFELSILDQIVLAGHAGDDTFIIDYANGDPTPGDPLTAAGDGTRTIGFAFLGLSGSDTVQIETTENAHFDINANVGLGFVPALPNPVDNPGANPFVLYPDYLNPFVADSDVVPIAGGQDTLLAQDGRFTIMTSNGNELDDTLLVNNYYLDIETLVGGSGDDVFDFLTGELAGDVEGREGDDRFIFNAAVRTDGSVNGGPGFNTLDLSTRSEPTTIEVFSVGINEGFNGRTLDGPIGEFSMILDQFRDISLIRGSTLINDDSIRALNVFEATYTLQIPDISPVNSTPDTADTFVASKLEQNGATLYFTDFDLLRGSVLNDTFNVLSNDGLALPFLQLDGRAGDDTFNFSSNAPENTGILADIDGIIEVNGSTGSNSLVVSDAFRLGTEEFLVLGARISGPVEIIFFAQDLDTFEEGTFDVTLIGSDNSEPDTFFLQSFLDQNTLNVFGMGGDDIFVIQDLSQAVVQVFGGEGDDDYIIEQVNGIDNRDVTVIDSVDAENDQAIIAGTILDEVFIVDLDSFASENFIFIGVEEFGFDGRGGDDEFYVRAIDQDFPVILRGGEGDDTFFLSSDAPVNLGDLNDLNNNLTIEDEVGTNEILISNESGAALDVEIFSDQIVGLFNGLLNYSGIFELIDIVGSNGGDDRFVITSLLVDNNLQIDGRLGEDEFIIGNADGTAEILGDVLLDGGSDGDTYTVFLANLMSENVSLLDTGFSGDDVLDAQATLGPDTITLTEFTISTFSQSIQINEFFEAINIRTLDGDDTITMMNAPADTVLLDAGEGNDQIIVNGTVGVNDLEIQGRAGADVIRIEESSAFTNIDAFGGTENDTFVVSSAAQGDVSLNGEEGSDTYSIGLAGNDRNLQINDVDSELEVHTLNITGTSDVEQITINNTSVVSGDENLNFDNELFDTLSINSFGGDDIINVIEANFDLTILSGNGDDTVTLASNTPLFSGNVDGITGSIFIDGGTGRNRLNISNETGTAGTVTVTSTSISGLTASPIVYVGRFDRNDGEIGGIHILGSDNGDDIFDITSLKLDDSIRVYGLSGDDIYNIGNGIAGDAKFDGGDGSDTYNFQFGSTAVREIVIEDLGVTGMDVLNLAGSDANDNIVISTDSISDAFTDLVFNIPLEEIQISGLLGNDTFTINGAALENVTLQGNEGSDTFIVNNTEGITNLDLFGGLDGDNFVINGTNGQTRIDAFGSLGNDSFRVEQGALGNMFLDGEIGSDTYNVSLGADGERRIDTRDSGANGFDRTIVTGTSGADRIAIRTTRFLYNDEIIIFNENTESVAANSADGSDRIVLFGSRSPLTEVFAGAGNDNFIINGGSRADIINLQGQDGDDTFTVFKTSAGTTTNLFGNQNNDRFNIGSTVQSDDGNLGLIRGELNIFGGGNDAGQEDRLIANDNGSLAAYSYLVTPNRLSAIAGPANLPRVNFAGINYDASTELVRLDGTELANLFQVIASPTTRYFFDGNSPTGNVGDRLEVVFQPNDGRSLTITDANAGNGFVSFTNGNENIQFENIEMPNLGSSGGSDSLTLPDGYMDDFFSTADLGELDDLILDI